MNESNELKTEKELTPEQVHQLLFALMGELDAAGGAIVLRYTAERGLEPAGVAWLLSQACLSIVVSSYIRGGRTADELIAQIRAGWTSTEAAFVAQAAAGDEGEAP